MGQNDIIYSFKQSRDLKSSSSLCFDRQSAKAKFKVVFRQFHTDAQTLHFKLTNSFPYFGTNIRGFYILINWGNNDQHYCLIDVAKTKYRSPAWSLERAYAHRDT